MLSVTSTVHKTHLLVFVCVEKEERERENILRKTLTIVDTDL